MATRRSKNIKWDDLWTPNSLYQLCGPLDEVITKLQKVRDENPEYNDLSLNIEAEIEESYGGHYVDEKVSITGWRRLTSKEIEAKKVKAKKASEAAKKGSVKRKEEKEAAEKKEYERLRNKFE